MGATWEEAAAGHGEAISWGGEDGWGEEDGWGGWRGQSGSYYATNEVWSVPGGAWLGEEALDWSGGSWAGAWWGSETSSQTASWQPAVPSFTPSEEQVARVHFGKTYQVLSEVLEAHPKAFDKADVFLDLGCAPGGFSCRLLEERPSAQGFGVTLPVEAGGFPVLLEHGRLRVQGCNLMELASAEELDCPTEVDVCLADAQDLGRRTSQDALHRGGGRGGAGGRRSRGGGSQPTAAAAVGVGAACTVLGIWAMTLQELLLGLGRLRAGGTMFFRFGWRGRGQAEEPWYREATVWLLALVAAHFAEVKPFKSEFSHQADSSFYVLASGFRREAYLEAGLDALLRAAIANIKVCERASDLTGCMAALEVFATPERQTQVTELLESVGRQRAIGVATRQHLEGGARTNPDATIYISPVPFSLTLQRIRARLERYGKIINIKRRAHPVGVGADAIVQFTQPAHAAAALQAIQEMGVLGGNISANLMRSAQ